MQIIKGNLRALSICEIGTICALAEQKGGTFLGPLVSA